MSIVSSYANIDYDAFFKLYCDYISGDNSTCEDQLLKLFYQYSYNILYNKYSYLKGEELIKDIIQNCVIACTLCLRNLRDIQIDAFKAYYRRIISVTISTSIRDLSFVSYDLLDDLNIINEDTYVDPNPGFDETKYTNCLLYLYNKCRKKIRFIGAKQTLVRYLLWFIIFEGKTNNRLVHLKANKLDLVDELDFILLYSKTIYRIELTKLKSDKKIYKELLYNEV